MACLINLNSDDSMFIPWSGWLTEAKTVTSTKWYDMCDSCHYEIIMLLHKIDHNSGSVQIFEAPWELKGHFHSLLKQVCLWWELINNKHRLVSSVLLIYKFSKINLCKYSCLIKSKLYLPSPLWHLIYSLKQTKLSFIILKGFIYVIGLKVKVVEVVRK